MKNKILLFLFSFALFACSINAQTSMQGTIPSTVGGLPSGANLATCNGVTAAYLYVKPTLNYKIASFQIAATRVSTGMIGNCMLQGSTDGLNYIALSTTDSIHISNAATDPGDRLILLNSTSTAYPSNGLPYQYYRLKCTQIAGDTATVKGYFYGRQ